MVLKPISLPRDEQDANRVVYAVYWGARAEPPSEIARRLQDTLNAVSSLGGPYGLTWTLATDHGPVALPQHPSGWVDLVMSGYEEGKDGSPYVPGGSRLLFLTDTPDLDEITIKISLRAGRSEPAQARSANRLLVSASSMLATDFSNVRAASTPDAARRLVKDLVTIWAPDVVAATTSASIGAQFQPEWRGMPSLGAITWLSGRVWPLPPELPAVELEAFGEGSLVTVGSTQEPSFDADEVTAVARHLTEQGLREPAPATQDQEPHVPAVRDLINR